MNNLVTQNKDEPKSVIAAMADRFGMTAEAFELTVRATCMPTGRDAPVVTRAEFAAGIVVAHHYTLNPLLREIYFYPRKGGGIVPVVSVDGWASLINRRDELDGINFQDHHHAETGALISITCTIYRKDRKHPTTVTEYLSECWRDTLPWKMAHRMLRHKTLIQCARYAFGFAGIHDDDEAQKIVEAVEVEHTRIAGPEAPDDGQMIEAEEVLAAQASAPRREAPATVKPEEPAKASPMNHDHNVEDEEEDEFDPEAWVLEARVLYNDAQSEKRVDEIHTMFEDTASELPQHLRIQYEDAHQEALARFASGIPAAAEQPAGPDGPEDDDDGGFPGQSAIDALRTGATATESINLGDDSREGHESSDVGGPESDDEEDEDSDEAKAFKADMDAILNGTWATHDALKAAFDARTPDLQALMADGDISQEYDADLRARLREKWKALKAAVTEAAANQTGGADADAMTTRLREGLAKCENIDAVNALATETLPERNTTFGAKHPLFKKWKEMIVARRKELSAIG